MNLDWCAGFFDGEGSVGLYSGQRKLLQATISQNNKRTLDRFKEIIGFGKVYGPYGPYKNSLPGSKPHYRWEVTGSVNVLRLYKLFKGRLIGKKDHFDKVIQEYKQYVASGNSTKSGRPRGT